MFRKFFIALPIVVLAVGGSTACATKKFVRTSVGEVNEKVDSQGRAIEETQERTRKNEGRIGEVDSKASAAAQSAQAANDAAAAALASTSVMRPSFLRVRSCVSSIDRPCASTFSFTSPTLVRTNFLVAHAVVPPTARTLRVTAMNNFRTMIDPPTQY